MRLIPIAARPPLPLGVLAVAVVSLALASKDAYAASLGGAVTSVGMAATLATLLWLKGWQSHLGTVGLSTLAGLLALVTGAGLFWRSGAIDGLRGLTATRLGSRSLTNPKDTERRLPIGLPAGVERTALLDELRHHFFDLQTAWEQGAREAMRHMTTPDMLDELWAATSAGAGISQRSEFLSLHAELLFFEQQGAAQVVCVEYSGLVREAPASEVIPFREFWMLTRSDGPSAGWRLARHQGIL